MSSSAGKCWIQRVHEVHAPRCPLTSGGSMRPGPSKKLARRTEFSFHEAHVGGQFDLHALDAGFVCS